MRTHPHDHDTTTGGAVGGRAIAREHTGPWYTGPHDTDPSPGPGWQTGLRSAVDATVALPLDRMNARALRDVAREVTTQIARLESVRATAVTTARRTGAVASSGATSDAAWLADATGGTPTAAARTVALGNAMDRSPTLTAAVTTGRIGPEHAASLARAADRGVLDDHQLDQLTDDATTLPAGPFARTVRTLEARTDQRRLRRDEAHARQRRTARWWTTDHGTVQGEFRLDPVAGQTLVAALNALCLPDPADTPDHLRRTATQRRADALTELARQTLERGDTPTVRTVKPHITVTVPAAILTETDTDDPRQADTAAEQAGALGLLPDGTVLSAATVRRLACDATIRRLVLDPHGRPLDVGRATRTWSGTQRAALAAVDGGCRGPACDRPYAWTDIHHIRWWRRGGTTALDNGIPLCSRCHDLVHHHNWTIRLDPDTRTATWTDPDGRTTTTRPRGPAAPHHPHNHDHHDHRRR